MIPIEVKYRTLNAPTVSRAFRSFIDAYRPKIGFFITKDFNGQIEVSGCLVQFISFPRLATLLGKIAEG